MVSLPAALFAAAPLVIGGILLLRFPRLRRIRWKPLLVYVLVMTGVIWTVPQTFPERRVEIFKRAERILRRTGEAVPYSSGLSAVGSRSFSDRT